jgi:hypothetical protein
VAIEAQRPKAYSSFRRQEARPDASEDVATSNQNQGMANYLANQDKLAALARNSFMSSQLAQQQAQQVALASRQQAFVPQQEQPAPSRITNLRNWVDTDPTVIGMRTSPKKKKMGRRLPPKRP